MADDARHERAFLGDDRGHEQRIDPLGAGFFDDRGGQRSTPAVGGGRPVSAHDLQDAFVVEFGARDGLGPHPVFGRARSGIDRVQSGPAKQRAKQTDEHDDAFALFLDLGSHHHPPGFCAAGTSPGSADR